MKHCKVDVLARIARYALLTAAALLAVQYIVLAVCRVGYPFELEWMEGGVLEHVRRIFEGQKLYVSPSLDFVPFIYAPLYFYLGKMVSHAGGIGFAPLRALSFLASLGCMALIFYMVRKETRETATAFLASALFAATYDLSGAWLDLARIDSLFLLLLLAALYTARWADSLLGWCLAAVLMALSFLTKQVALVAALPVAVMGLISGWRHAVAFLGTLAVVVAGSTWALDALHDGWYVYYIFSLPSAHRMNPGYAADLWTSGFVVGLPIAVAAAAFGLIRGRAARTHGLMAVGMFAAALSSSLHSGSYSNALIPAHAMLAVLVGLGAHSAIERARSAGRRSGKLLEAAIYLVLIGQLAILAYDPRGYLPGSEDSRAGKALVEEISRMDGEVLVPRHGYLAAMAGKRSFAHEMAMNDVLKGDPRRGGRHLKIQILKALEARRFEAIVVDYAWLKPDIERYYRKKRKIFDNDDVFWPVTGVKTRPEAIYTR